MANLSSLIHELRDRIAASSSTSSSPPSTSDDPLEARFRAVLPHLLSAYVNPSSTSNEREVTAVLKLLAHTARNFPGVFHHGKASAVLPIVGRVIPFLAEPAFCSRHGIIFETVASVLSLLRTGEREIYRQFFLDAMEVVEDILYVASLYSNKVPLNRVSLKCFSESFAAISTVPSLFGELPACCQPVDGPGVLVDLPDKQRWQLFAGWMVKLISKCMTEGTLYVEGLVRMSFVSSVCSLLCFGDAALHMACYDFARITATVIDEVIIPVENIIRSMACILEQGDEFGLFRSAIYDSSMGACLHVLHSTCRNDIVESTARDIVEVFPRSLQSTESHELQVALCNAYIRITKICPVHIWKPEILVKMLCFPKPCLPLIECIRVAVSILGSYRVREDSADGGGLSTTGGKELEIPNVGNKRSAEDSYHIQLKRQKTSDIGVISIASGYLGVEISDGALGDQEKQYAHNLQHQFASFIDLLNPSNAESSHLRPEIAILALSLLCIAFQGFPSSSLSLTIFQQVLSWIPWIISSQVSEKLHVCYC